MTASERRWRNSQKKMDGETRQAIGPTQPPRRQSEVGLRQPTAARSRKLSGGRLEAGNHALSPTPGTKTHGDSACSHTTRTRTQREGKQRPGQRTQSSKCAGVHECVPIMATAMGGITHPRRSSPQLAREVGSAAHPIRTAGLGRYGSQAPPPSVLREVPSRGKGASPCCDSPGLGPGPSTGTSPRRTPVLSRAFPG